MLERIDIANVLFLDIETVSGQPNYEALDEEWQALWQIKGRALLRRQNEEPEAEELAELYNDRAGIYAEFGKVVCISVGVVHRDKEDQRLKLRLTSFADEDEAKVLQEFAKLVATYYNNTNKHYLCGHNIREFDIPYICRRMVVHGLSHPAALDLAGKRPWEAKHLLDTLELWKFGDYKNYTSLKQLAKLLGFPSPKDDIDGSNVGGVYWEENDLPRIALYCEKDVLATVQLFLRYQYQPLLEEDQIVHV